MSLKTSTTSAMTPDSLRKQANSFAQEVQDLLRRTLDGIGPDDVHIVRQREGGHSVTLRTDEEAPVVARVSGRPLLLLDLKYQLELSSDGTFLRTEQMRAVSRERVSAVTGAVDDEMLASIREWIAVFLGMVRDEGDRSGVRT